VQSRRLTAFYLTTYPLIRQFTLTFVKAALPRDNQEETATIRVRGRVAGQGRTGRLAVVDQSYPSDISRSLRAENAGLLVSPVCSPGTGPLRGLQFGSIRSAVPRLRVIRDRPGALTRTARGTVHRAGPIIFNGQSRTRHAVTIGHPTRTKLELFATILLPNSVARAGMDQNRVGRLGQIP
jgi:hypothetical protein